MAVFIVPTTAPPTQETTQSGETTTDTTGGTTGSETTLEPIATTGKIRQKSLLSIIIVEGVFFLSFDRE
jgi:hypothetical protein